jgi:hypothetical protein
VRKQASQVPAASWKAERVEADLALSKQLAAKLDAEKGIESNPLDADSAAEAPPGDHPILTLLCSSGLQ